MIINWNKDAWVRSSAVFLSILILMVLLFQQTIVDTAMIWWDASDTYVHGMFVVPAVIWMTWFQREQYLGLTPQPGYIGIAGIAFFAILWVISSVAGIAVGQQLSFFAMLPMLVISVFGVQISKTIWFSLLFLIFAVPMGEFLIPYLMKFTAWFSVTALQITGIPVYWEGLSFEIPSGSFEVVKACSGIRYLIASVALGYFYAFLTYKTTFRRLCFVSLAIAFPIFANGLRAYGIVMIAHLSSMEHATGFDHIIYGWVWFGVVMLLMFWIGTLWREDREPRSELQLKPIQHGERISVDIKVISAAVISVLLAPAVLYLLTNVKAVQPPKDLNPVNAFKSGIAFVGEPCYLTGAQYPLADMMETGCFYFGDTKIGYANAQYFSQDQNKELISVTNKLYDTENWKKISDRGGVLDIKTKSGPISIKITETLLKDKGGEMLVWSWYKVGGIRSSGKITTKLNQVKSILFKRRSDAIIEILSVRINGSTSEARNVIRSLVTKIVRISEQKIPGK
ncbi:MAG: exosortase A [Gammaproteobacteria bacterium]|nr:MAG: exosortase A [Gammaproteobacteria bacterium]